MDKIIIGIVAGIFSVVSFYANYRNRKLYFWVKPVPLMLIAGLYLFYFISSPQKNLFHSMIILGLLLGMAGDIVLVLDEKFFIFGLVAFLAGHVCYAVSFSRMAFDMPALIIGAVTAVMSFYFIILTNRMKRDLKKKLYVPLIFYFLAITMMLLFSINYDLNDRYHLPLFAIGSVLFVVSDAALAWVRFVNKSSYAEYTVLPTYYTAQILIGMKGISILTQGFII